MLNGEISGPRCNFVPARIPITATMQVMTGISRAASFTDHDPSLFVTCLELVEHSTTMSLSATN